MKLGIKELLIIGSVSVISFPVTFFTMLFITGNAKIQFAGEVKEKVDATAKKFKIIKYTQKKDSLVVLQSQAYLASLNEKKELEREREKLSKQQERINIMRQDLERTKQNLAEERKKFEKIVETSDELEIKKIKQLAKVYSAMRPEEAARILETLDDKLVIKILSSMGDDRQKAKILGSLSQDKSSKISEQIGTSLKK